MGEEAALGSNPPPPLASHVTLRGSLQLSEPRLSGLQGGHGPPPRPRGSGRFEYSPSARPGTSERAQWLSASTLECHSFSQPDVMRGQPVKKPAGIKMPIINKFLVTEGRAFPREGHSRKPWASLQLLLGKEV